MLKIFMTILASLLFFNSSILQSNASEMEPISGLIGERLSHMQNVALYKEAHHIPIEDLEQEERVIKRSLERAQALGLDQDSVKLFIDMQMKAAKAVQYRYRADWLFKRESIVAPETLDSDRTKIADLGNKLLEMIAETLKKGTHIEQSGQESFVNSLSGYNLQHNEKVQIFDALRQIKLAPQ